MPDFDVVVIGAGPAGLAAATRAAQAGARTAMVDDNPHPGGQIWRAAAGKSPKAAQTWLRDAEAAKVDWIPGARVFAAPAPNRLSLEKFDGEIEIGYRKLILATGARERFLPFPGWTLPNVMGAGGLQALAKSGLPVEGKKIIVAGSGPLLLAVAKYMKDHGANVRAIVEQASQASLMSFGLSLISHPAKLVQAIGLRAGLLGIPYRTSCWPVAAQGKERLESVTLRSGGKTWIEACDYLACGFGLIPNTEIAALLGCQLRDGHVVVNEFQQTTQPGIYSAGEATGIGGLELSLIEGEIAGYAAAGVDANARSNFLARDFHREFARALDRAFALNPELKSLPQPETLVCRCEDVTWSRVQSCTGWREAKLHTRCGMGPCQGRICGGAVEFLKGWTAESVRPPIFPARIESLSTTEKE